MQEKETTKSPDSTDISRLPAIGRIVALDIGTKHVGVAVCDELRVTTRPVKTIQRSSWKKLLLDVKTILAELDAAGLVLGLPLNTDGSESEMSLDVRRLHRNFSLSLHIPVYLQDERVSSYEAKRRLWEKGMSVRKAELHKDTEAARIILADFMDRLNAADGK